MFDAKNPKVLKFIMIKLQILINLSPLCPAYAGTVVDCGLFEWYELSEQEEPKLQIAAVPIPISSCIVGLSGHYIRTTDLLTHLASGNGALTKSNIRYYHTTYGHIKVRLCHSTKHVIAVVNGIYVIQYTDGNWDLPMWTGIDGCQKKHWDLGNAIGYHIFLQKNCFMAKHFNIIISDFSFVSFGISFV